MPRQKKDPNAQPTPDAQGQTADRVLSFQELAELTKDQAWLPLSEAASYSQRTKAAVKAAMIKLPEIFNAANVQKIGIKGFDYAPAVYVSKSALDAWIAQRSNAPASGSRQRTHDQGRKYFVFIKDSDYNANDSFTIAKTDLKLAFKPKEKQSATPSENTTNAVSSNGRQTELELVEA